MNESSPPTVASHAWLIVVLLFPVALLNYLDRQMLATMQASMIADIPTITSKADWGLVLGSFKWVYAILSPFAGYVADRFSRRLVIIVSLGAWSIVTWMTGHVHTLDQLVATRALMGISEAFYVPAALALIADFHLGATRSRAIGLHQTGIQVGTLLGGFAGYIAAAEQFGWRWAFSTCGLVGVLYAIPLMLFLRNPIRARSHVGGSAPSVGVLLANRNFILLVMYFTLPAIAGWVVRDWMPAILKEQFNLGQGHAGVSAVLFVQIATIVGSLLGGVLADRWSKRNLRGRIYVSALGTACFLPALFGVGNASTLAMAVGFLILFGIGWGFFDCNNMPILCQIARPELRATGYGIMNMVSISCGGFGDWLFGTLRDRHVALNAIFGCFAGVAILSVIIVLMIRPKSLDVRA